ncbi:MAG: hypothetical protein HOV83_41285 [Catenulispora sp.]|nr:hypothetical protein [Catenulispora sp.]
MRIQHIGRARGSGPTVHHDAGAAQYASDHGHSDCDAFTDVYACTGACTSTSTSTTT